MRTSKFVVAAVIGMVCVGASALPAHGISQLDFAIIAPSGGVISFSGASGDPLIGVNIDIDEVVGLDTPSNPNIRELVVNGLLNFHSGGSITQFNDMFWTFEAGGEITITGAVPAAGITDPDSLLLSGSFQSAQVVPAGLTFRVAVAEFMDIKDARLAEYFGLPGGAGSSFRGNLNLSFLAFGSTTPDDLEDGFESFAVLSGDVVNTPIPVPIPAPAAVWAGTAILGLIMAVGFRRMQIATRDA